MKLKDQLTHVMYELEANISITSTQKTIIRNTLCAIHSAEMLLDELEQADNIIKNCINSMTEEQRLAVANLNHQQNQTSGWAYRADIRKQATERGRRYFGGAV